MIDIRKIRKLIELVEKSNIAKLEISEENKSIRIIRSTSDKLSPSSIVPVIKQSEIPTFKLNKNQDNKCNIIDEYIIRSPMVGIFYNINKLDNKPFVSVGQSVKIGDVLCIIEAMKVMNQIQSDQSGIIKSILIKNGHPVEFEEPLLIIHLQE